jgi:hypothetical protein
MYEALGSITSTVAGGRRGGSQRVKRKGKKNRKHEKETKRKYEGSNSILTLSNANGLHIIKDIIRR